MLRERKAMSQAYQEIPIVWHEKGGKKRFQHIQLGAVLSNSLAYVFINETYSHIFTNNPIATGLSAAAVYALSAITDHFSTKRLLNSMDAANQAGIATHHYEINEFLKNATTAEEIKRNKKFKMVQMGVALASIIAPPVGLAIAESKFLATISNRRAARRYDRAVEIARSR